MTNYPPPSIILGRVSTTQYITRRDLITALRSALAKYEKRRQKEDLEPQIKEYVDKIIEEEVTRTQRSVKSNLIFIPARGVTSGPPAGSFKVTNLYVAPGGELIVEYDA